jgi:hypothetical protein
VTQRLSALYNNNDMTENRCRPELKLPAHRGLALRAYAALLGLLMCFFSCLSHAAITEQLGTVGVTDLLIKPYFLLSEPQKGEFKLGDSSVQMTWRMDQNFQSSFRIGPKSLRNTMIHFEDEADDSIGIVEGYAQFSSVYGQIRYGLIPIQYAVEGEWQERQLLLPRSLFFKERLNPLRGLGAMYSVQHNGFHSSFSVFNGEGENNPDGLMWFAGKWGWQKFDNLKVGISSLTGESNPTSTTGLADSVASINVEEDALWRQGTFYFLWTPSEWKTLIEVTAGELVQDEKVTGKYSGGHFDIMYDSESWAGLLRYDSLDRDSNTDEDAIREISIGIIFKNAKQTSWVKIIGTKRYEEGERQIPNDQLRLVWQLTPLIDVVY